MAGDFVPEEELKLKGFQKYFNSYTLRGRFNWACATYGTLFSLFLWYKIHNFANPKDPKPAPPGGEPGPGSSSSDSQLETKICRTNEYY